MCTNGSRSDMLTPANARRTGNPSPSKPLGAVVTDAKGRSVITVDSGSLTRGRAATLSTVTAGMEVSYHVQGIDGRVRPRLPLWFSTAHWRPSHCTEPGTPVEPSIRDDTFGAPFPSLRHTASCSTSNPSNHRAR